MSADNRIRWTIEERSLVVSNMAKLLNKGRYVSRVQLVKDAQEWLLSNRRRTVFGNNELKEMNAKAHTLAANSVKDMIVDAEKAVVEHACLPQRDELTVLLESLIDKIADKVANKLAACLQPVTVPAGSVQGDYPTYTHRPKHNPEPPCNAPRVVKTGVLILGMQPHQGNLLKQEFPMLDITCYDSDEARTKQVLLRAHTIGMTRFLSHQVEDRYRKCPRYHRHATGVSELKTLLKQIAQGTV